VRVAKDGSVLPPGDPLIGPKIVEVDYFASRQWVTCVQCDISDVVEQRRLGEALKLRQGSVCPILGNYQIDVSPNEKRNRLRRFLLGQHNP